MQHYIQDWLRELEHASPFWGIPLVLFGLTLMFMGGQFHKSVVPFVFILVGLAIGQLVFARSTTGLLVGAAIGVLLALISALVARYSVAALGGLCGTLILTGYLSVFEQLVLPDAVNWGIAAFGFLAGTSLAFVMHREMIMIVTAFVGSLFLIGGLNTIMPQAAPTLYSTVTQFLSDYPAFMVPFLVGGPTLIGALVQMSNANRGEAGAT